MAQRFPFSVFGGGSGSPAGRDATSRVHTAQVVAGSVFIVYGNGTELGRATADGTGKAIVTLASAPAAGVAITYGLLLSGGTIPATPQVLSISGSPASATVGSPYTFTPTVSGGSGVKSYALVGSLLAGLSFSSGTGAITGTPTTAGTASGLSITVTDSSGSATLAGLTITANAAAPSVDLMVFGDSIKEAEQSAGTSVAQRQSGLFMNLSGAGEIMTGLAQSGWPLRFDAYNDTAGSQPSLLGNPVKYYKGGNFSQAGATIANILDQIDYAKAQGFNPKAIILEGGTNSLPLDQAAHLALIDKILGYWPNVKIGVENVRPVGTSTAAGTGNRTDANIQDANAKIAANVSARASSGGGVFLIDLYSAYKARGSGTLGNPLDFADGLHNNDRGASGAAAPVYRAFFAARFSGESDKSEAHKVASVLPNQSQQVQFNGAPYTVSVAAGTAGSNDGTITGSMPTGMTIAKVGNVRSNIVTSIVDRGDGTKAIRVQVSKIATNTTERFRIYDTGINAHTTTALAGQWFESVATVADDRNAGWVRSALSWLERSNTSGNTVVSTYGLAQDGGAPITAGAGPMASQSGARVTKLLSPAKKGEASSTGSQREINFTFDPSAGDTMTIDIQLMDIRTRTPPQGAS